MEFKIPKSKALGHNFKEPKINPKDGTPIGPDKREFYVNLHLSFDGFKPIRMPEIPANYDEDEPHFTLFRMVPPGQLSYFYSLGDANYMDEIGKDVKTLLDHNNPVMKHKLNVHLGEHK